MPSHALIQQSNAKITDSTAPKVAVFVGATAGIAKAALTQLISKNTPITVYVLGRNGDKHESYLQQLQTSNSKASVVWLEGQISLLSEIRRLCAEIRRLEDSIDLLFLCAGYLPFGGRVETSEGLDMSNSLNYWGRALFTELLLPLLRAKPDANLSYASRVVSILAAGEETDKIPLDDLDLRQPQNFGISRIGPHQATLNTIFFSRIASKPENRNVIFIHTHPGIVSTGITGKNWGENWWGPILVMLLEPLIHLFLGISIEVSAERSLYLITSAEYGGIGVELPKGAEQGITDTREDKGGLFCISSNMDSIVPNKEVFARLRANNAYDIIWQETQKTIQPFM